MKTKITLVLLVLFFVLMNAVSLKASHLAGGSITYQCVSGNNYNVTLTLYRDCLGISIGTPILTVRNSCTNTSRTVPYSGPAVTPVLITPPCNGGILTTCNSGSAPGIQRYDLTYNVTLVAAEIACPDMIFSYAGGARNAQVCASLNENFYLEAHLNPVSAPCNTSPTFNNEPLLFYCLYQNNITDNSAKLSSCDSLSYSLMCPMQAASTCVCYRGEYNPGHFIAGTVILDSTTGIVSAMPTTAGEVSVYAVKVTQWRKINGIWTKAGWIERDILTYMISCVNNLPTMTGIDSTNQYSITFAADKTTCFNIYSADIDALDSVSLTWNNEIPNASFSTTSINNSDVGLFCWQPTMADTGCAHCFTVKAKDTGCPQNGVSYSRYCISVTDSITLKADDLVDQKYSVSIFPNPFSKSTKIILNNSSPLTNTQFTLSDIFGRNVMNRKMEKNELVIERGNLAEGIYFYSIQDNDKIIATGKILIVE